MDETTDPGKDTGTGSGGTEDDKKDPGTSDGTTNTGNTTKTDNGADGQKKAVKTGDEARLKLRELRRSYHWLLLQQCLVQR